jgi:hypothetical protein
MTVEIASEFMNVAGGAGEFAKDAAVFLGIVGAMVSGAVIWIVFFSEAGKKAAREIRQASRLQENASAFPSTVIER